MINRLLFFVLLTHIVSTLTLREGKKENTREYDEYLGVVDDFLDVVRI